MERNKRHGILFIESSIPPSRGGVQRVSWLLAESFRRYGYPVCFAYFLKDYELVPESNKIRYSDSESIKALIDKFSKLVISCDVRYIICQGLFNIKLYNLLLNLKKRYDCKIISCLHNNPGFEKFRNSRPTQIQKIKNLLKQIMFPWRIKNIYKAFYSLSDKFVLLSDSFKKDFESIYKIGDSTKLYAIPNPLSFEHGISESEMDYKKNQVLIISRLEDIQKNITAALRIWKKIETSDKADNWNLLLGGYGQDEQKILEYAKSLELHNFKFIGKIENPQKWYKESKIFMMTSRFEGFGMTLLEASQNACVPFAFDSYSSLHDIIKNQHNGFIIQNNDEQSYANTMLGLMNDNVEWKKMAENAVNSSKRFSISNITNQWLTLFEELN